MKLNIKKLTFATIALAVVLFSAKCTKEEMKAPTPATEGILELNFSATGNGSALKIGENFQDPMNRTMQVKLLKFYTSNIYLTSGSSESLIKDVELISFESETDDPTSEKRKITLQMAPGSYDGIKLGIGLDATKNNSDPSSYDTDHPLHSSNNTYWGAWSKYKFIMVEGFADYNGGSAPSSVFNYHTGYDESYRQVSFSKPITIAAGSVTEVNFTIEINDIFFGSDTLDIELEPTWHGDTTVISRSFRISDNFAAGLKIE